MAVKMGSFRYHFVEKSKERLLSYKGYSQIGLGTTEGNDEGTRYKFFQSLGEKIAKFWIRVRDFSVKAWQMGVSDPRKIIFAAKMGLALVLISLLMFLKEPFGDLSRHSVWAILTVVVMFEFSIGATLSKGLNRALGTFSAGGLALAMAELAELCGEWEEIVVVLSIFITGFCATYAKLYPTMKAYEYGFRVFLLTYCFVMVSGYRTREFVHTAVTRFFLIAIGAGVGFGVNVCIYPIWAGEDLHNVVAKNFTSVAASLEGCVREYLECLEYVRIPSKILTYQASDDPVYSGYRSAVESTSQEDVLMGFAVWEPPHGPYKTFNYPWKDYVRVSGALRHCAFMVMALHGCILSEIQAPPERRRVFSSELQRVGTEGAKVLRDLGDKIKKMEKLRPGDILLEVHEAAEELQRKIDRRSYLLVNSESWEIGTRPKVLENPEDLLDMNDDENNFLGVKSHSETVLNLRSAPVTRSWDDPQPFHLSISDISMPNEEASRTYESASALSLATFASLLIEFVARLQNLVDSFEELSEKAKFKEPIDPPESTEVVVGFWTKLWRCLWFKN